LDFFLGFQDKHKRENVLLIFLFSGKQLEGKILRNHFCKLEGGLKVVFRELGTGQRERNFQLGMVRKSLSRDVNGEIC